jgi:hypothetical protein
MAQRGEEGTRGILDTPSSGMPSPATDTVALGDLIIEKYQFYACAVISGFAYLITFAMYSPIFSGWVPGYRVSWWGIVCAVLLHILRWWSYYHAERRVRSAFLMIIFVTAWLCCAFFFEGNPSNLLFFNPYVFLGYFFVGLPLFLRKRWAQNHSDRVFLMWYLAGVWLMLTLSLISGNYYIWVILLCGTDVGAMALLQKRVRDKTYIQPRGRNYSRDHTLGLCMSVLYFSVFVLQAVLVLCTRQHRILQTPSLVALYFVITVFLTSEYVFYVLNKCALISREQKEAEK